MSYKIIQGDSLQVLKTLDPESVNCCITSPPYFGLRDYGVEGQIGLEKTPDEYVAKMVEVFREVRRVLRDDGTLWLNLGDSYAGSGKGGNPEDSPFQKQRTNAGSLTVVGNTAREAAVTKCAGEERTPSGLKPKDLCGIPWRVALALQAPQYTGTIVDEHDRIWLAAMIDTEGCMFIHKRKAGQNNGQGYERQNDNYAPGLEVSNTSESIVNRCLAIVGKGSICSQTPDQNNRRKQTIYRWNLRTTECRDIVREVYPYLVAKKHQARILIGCPSSGEKAHESHQSLIALHNGGQATIDFPEPDSMFQPGWYLRQDIIWKKPNPMPESVTDRCTKAHEYLFLLSKKARYYFDAKAIAEPAVESNAARPRMGQGQNTQYAQKRGEKVPSGWDTDSGSHGAYHRKGRGGKTAFCGQGMDRDGENGPANREGRDLRDVGNGSLRNKRSVWTIPTQAYPEAHFATFPEALVSPCVLAGCPADGTVLDPFNGSGTTGLVALKHGRNYVGIELNPAYVAMAEKRIHDECGLLI